VRHAREVAARARNADRELDDLSGEGSRDDSHRCAALAAKDEQPFARADEQLGLVVGGGHGASGDRGEHVDSIVGLEGVVHGGRIPVDEHVDVAPDRAPLVEDPSRGSRVRPF
jgi:hypothetical protein